MPRIINQPEDTVTVRILAGQEFRGRHYCEPAVMHLSPNYAEHVVGKGVAEYVTVDENGDFDDSLAAEQVDHA
jgi:hypothetical protein